MGELTGGNLVEKSKALVWARFRDYTAGELRLLEVYLSRINPRDPESATVKFTLQEYCEFLGLRMNSKTLKAQLMHFLENVVAVPISGSNEYRLYTLFTMAEVRTDPDIRSYMVSIECNPKLQPVFFDIAKNGYVKYRLRYTASMKSQYSILLYSMLRDWLNTGRKEHEITIDRLRDQFGANDKSYDLFKDFRKRVLDVAVDEINLISDIHVEYSRVKSNRKVVAIKFKVELKKYAEPVIDAESSEIETVPLKDAPEREKPVRSPRSAAYEDVDWESIVPDVEKKQCASIARSVARRLKSEYPNIRADKKKDAVVNIVQGAYEQAIKDNSNVDVPEAYLRTTINNSPLSKFATFGFDYLE